MQPPAPQFCIICPIESESPVISDWACELIAGFEPATSSLPMGTLIALKRSCYDLRKAVLKSFSMAFAPLKTILQSLLVKNMV